MFIYMHTHTTYICVFVGCDISLKDNKLVSGHHCYILRDESGKVWLHDTRYLSLSFICNIFIIGQVSYLSSSFQIIDLSAAFDIIDHNRLGATFGVDGAVLVWFQSDLHFHVQFVVIDGIQSFPFYLSHGCAGFGTWPSGLYTLCSAPV